MRHWQTDPDVSARFIPIDPVLPRWLAWVERIRYLRTIVRMPFYLSSLWRGTTDADIVHIFSASYWSFLLAPVPAWLTGRLRRKATFDGARLAQIGRLRLGGLPRPAPIGLAPSRRRQLSSGPPPDTSDRGVESPHARAPAPDNGRRQLSATRLARRQGGAAFQARAACSRAGALAHCRGLPGGCPG